MQTSRRPTSVLFVSAAVAVLSGVTSGVAAQARAGQGTHVSVVRTAGATRVTADRVRPDGTSVRLVLRETSAAVQRGAQGADPARRALFVDWSENGQRWFSYSRDGGETWKEARPVQTALLLRDAHVEPGAALPAVAEGLALESDGRLYLVQFRTLSLPEWRLAVAEAGGELLRAFPYNAHIVRMSPAVLDAVRALPFVQRIVPYHPAYRLEPALRRWVSGSLAGSVRTQERRVNIVALQWGREAKDRIAEFARTIGARVVNNPPSGEIIELVVDPEQLRRLAGHDDVESIDTWAPPADDMDLVRRDSGANFVEDTVGFCGQGVRGEVMDGGVERTHQDFDGIFMHNDAGVASHGTATYGIVFGNGSRDGDGNAQATGLLPCAQGIFASRSGDRFTQTQQLKRAPLFASFQSNSWGSGLTTEYTSSSRQLDDIIWRLDVAICQSQSNDGTRMSRPQAWAKNVISVGGIRHRGTLSETDDRWGGGASIGPAADGRVKPDVYYWNDGIFTTAIGNGYAGFGGTSAATPEVAGVLGIMLQMWSENVWKTNPSGATVFERQPHASTLKALLVNNAKQLPFSGVDADLTRTHQGWGRPNVRLAYERAANSFIVDEGTPLALDERATYTVQVPAGETELKVTMVYPDPPGTTSATLHRINDLSLKVTSPSGEVYHGNHGLDVGNVSIPGGQPNTVDTVENVFVRNPASGDWKVELHAAEINQDAHRATPAADAVFALVVTGAKLSGTPPPSRTTVFADDFEAENGWTTNPDATDTATTGRWEHGQPEATVSDGTKQLGAAASGTNALVTGRAAGASAGANDIDGGTTSVRSPLIALPSTGDLTFTFSQYLAHRSNASNADFLRVAVVSGTATTTVFEKLGSATDVDGAWSPVSVNLNAFRGQPVRILVTAADTAGASLVEAGIDDVRILQQE